MSGRGEGPPGMPSAELGPKGPTSQGLQTSAGGLRESLSIAAEKDEER